MAISWGGVAAMVVFYLIILVIGLWAARKTKGDANSERIQIADRKLGWVLCFITITASLTGGGSINGTSEIIFTPGFGLLWAQAPYCVAIGLILNGLFFVEKMRRAKYVTMLDPFSDKYGVRMTCLIFLIAMQTEITYSAAILTALGSTVSVILDLDRVLSVVISTCIAAFYTLFGGLWSVAYTDVAQLLIMLFGLWLSIPFAVTNPAVAPLHETTDLWLGQWDNKFVWMWIDVALLITFGSIPWQALYQRVLASQTPKVARYSTLAASLGVCVCAIPAYILGMVGASANWEETSLNLNKTDIYSAPSLILPAVIQYLTPAPVAFIGLGAVSAAVMSSTDSSFHSIASMYCRNVHKNILRVEASERELIWVMRLTVVVVAALACVLALAVNSTYGLLILTDEFVYVLLVPQMVCVIHVSLSNTYGALASFVVGLTLRLMSGEPTLALPPLIRYPLFEVFYDVPTQFFPFRTFIMVIALLTLVLVSHSTNVIFRRGWLPKKWDVFRCVVNVDESGTTNTNTVNNNDDDRKEMDDLSAGYINKAAE